MKDPIFNEQKLSALPEEWKPLWRPSRKTRGTSNESKTRPKTAITKPFHRLLAGREPPIPPFISSFSSSKSSFSRLPSPPQQIRPDLFLFSSTANTVCLSQIYKTMAVFRWPVYMTPSKENRPGGGPIGRAEKQRSQRKDLIGKKIIK